MRPSFTTHTAGDYQWHERPWRCVNPFPAHSAYQCPVAGIPEPVPVLQRRITNMHDLTTRQVVANDQQVTVYRPHDLPSVPLAASVVERFGLIARSVTRFRSVPAVSA